INNVFIESRSIMLISMFSVVGMVMAMSGVSLLMKYRHYSLFFSQTYILLPVVFTICSAAFLLFTGFLGTWLSLRDSRCLQGLVRFIPATVGKCMSLDSDTASLNEVFQKYTGSSQDRNSRIVDITQEELHCCGVRNYTDWLDSSWLNKTGGDAVPRSCCNTTFLLCKGSLYQPWQLYHQVDKTASIMQAIKATFSLQNLQPQVQLCLKKANYTYMFRYVYIVGLFCKPLPVARNKHLSLYHNKLCVSINVILNT
uniref:Tetraspanin 37 n=1 Tax=Poecilia reticulata TaxID=8081 RepID=A0A3P9P3H8_POERE